MVDLNVARATFNCLISVKFLHYLQIKSDKELGMNLFFFFLIIIIDNKTIIL
jgi:hypothetical protein